MNGPTQINAQNVRGKWQVVNQFQLFHVENFQRISLAICITCTWAGH